MTEQMHPMVPSQELLRQWENDWFAEREHADVLLIQAYQAGADAEFEACCEWLKSKPDPDHIDLLRGYAADLCAARRPKPPSLKKQALMALAHILNNSSTDLGAETIRRALEALPDD